MSFPTPQFNELGPEAAAPRPKPRPTAEVTTRCKTIIPPLAFRSPDTSRNQQHQRDAPSSSSGSGQSRSYQREQQQQQQQQQASVSPFLSTARAAPQQRSVLSSAMAASSSSSASTQPVNPARGSDSGSGFSHHDPIVLSPDLPTIPLPADAQFGRGSPSHLVISHRGQAHPHTEHNGASGGNAQDRSASQIARPSFTAQQPSSQRDITSSFSSAARLQTSGERALDYRANSSAALSPQGHHFHGSGIMPGKVQASPPSTFGSHSSVSMPKPATTTPFPSSAFPASNAGLLYWNSHEDSILLAAVERSANWSQLHARFHATSSVPRTSNALSHRLLKLHREGKTRYQPSDLGPLNPVSTSSSGMARTPVKVVRCDAWSEEEMEIVRRGLAKGKDWAAICREYERAFGTKKRSREAIRKRMRNMSKASEACREDEGDGDEDAKQSISHGTRAYNHFGPASSRSAPTYPTVSPSRSSSSSPFGSHDQDDFSPSIEDEDEEGEDYQHANDAHASSRAWSVWSKHDDQLLLDSIAPYRKGNVKWAEVVDRFNKSCDKQRIQKTLQNRACYLKTMQQQTVASAGSASTSVSTPSSPKRERTAPKARWLDAEIKVLRDSLARHHRGVPYSYSGVYKDFFRAFPRSKRSRSAVRHRCVQLAGLQAGRRSEEDRETEDEGEWDSQGDAEAESDGYEDEKMGSSRKRGRTEQCSHGGKPYKPAKSQRQGRQHDAYEADSSYLDDSFDYSHSHAVALGTASAQPPTLANSSTWSQQQSSPPGAPYTSSRVQELAVGVTYEATGVRIEGCIPGLEVMVLSPTCVKLITTQEGSDESFEEQPAFHLRCLDGAVQAVVLPQDTTMSTSIVERQQGAARGWGVQTAIRAVDGFSVALIS